jgi:hypothetical protein
MSGAYFSLNMIWSQVFPYVAMFIYVRYGEHSTSRLSPAELRNALIPLSLLWTASALTFAASIKRKYWQTFLSTETASQYAIRLFREAKDDEMRFDAVFGNHCSYTAPIADGVKAWLHDRYPVWRLEHPPWFTEAAISRIPDEMLPKEALKELLSNGGGVRRRSSLGELLLATGNASHVHDQTGSNMSG